MSVDYLVCDCCGNTFPDCGYFVTCEQCGTDWCSDECAEVDGYIKEHCSKHPDLYNRSLMEEYRKNYCGFDDCIECEHYNPESCNYCRGEDYEDDVLLEKALELLKMTRDELIAIINNECEEE